MPLSTIIGSETEFGLVPRAAGETISERNRHIVRVLDALRTRLHRSYLVEEELREAMKQANWWREDLRASEAPSDRASEQDKRLSERWRRLGFSGIYTQSGGRMYVDGYHLEYSTPECPGPHELIVHERAGEYMARELLLAVEKEVEFCVDLVKRNWDYKAASYACHENYLVSATLFGRLTRERMFPMLYRMHTTEQSVWAAYLATRIIYTGSGKLKSGMPWPSGFSLSPRASFIDHFASSSTMGTRGIINTRHRPYADPAQWGRLHVIAGDSNRADWSNVLKYGVARIMLSWLEDFSVYPPCQEMRAFARGLDPVRELLMLNEPLSDEATRKVFDRALRFQFACARHLQGWLAWRKGQGEDIPWAEDVMKRWLFVLDALDRHDIDVLSDKLDWAIKKSLYGERMQGSDGEKKIRSLDYSYHVVGDASLFTHLVGKGRIATLVTEKDVFRARANPPNTRALLRESVMRLFQNDIQALSWHYVYLWYASGGAAILMPDPRSSSFLIQGCDATIEASIRERLKRGGIPS